MNRHDIGHPNEGGNAFMGLQAMFSFDVKTVSHVTNWFLQLVFAANAATIVSGSIAERCHFSAYLAYSFIITGNLIFFKCSISYEKHYYKKIRPQKSKLGPFARTCKVEKF